MGGLVARSYMNEQTHQTLRGPEPGGDRVSQLITLATPHHGTPLANGSARVPGWESDWNWLAAQLDAMVWNSPSQGSTLSSLQSNRADLRWDDVYPINWPGKYDGTVETNSWLAGVPHTYDYKITAFYGVIGGGGFIVPYGGYGPAGTEVPFGSPGIWDVMQQPHNTAQAISVLAVITERIMDNAFGSSDTIYSVVNDGVVPAESGEFAGSAATPISCTGRDHTQMIEDPQGLPCKSGPLFSSILSILGVSATSPPPLITISPDDSWSFGSINVGNSSLETFALSNDGGGTLTVTSVITSGDSEFSIVGAPISQFSLTPGTSQTVTVRFQPTSGGSKSAALIVNSNASNNSAKTISLTGTGVASNPCSYSLTSTVASVGSGSGSGGFTVNAGAGCTWTVSAGASWVTIVSPSGGSGSATQTVTFQVGANNTGAPQTTVINVQGGSQALAFQLTQDYADQGCTYAVSPGVQSMPSSAGGSSFLVSSPSTCGWSASSNTPWITVTTSGTHLGSASVSYTLAGNSNSSQRIGTITVTGQNGSTVFSIIQSGAANSCSYSISPAQASSIYQGGATYINVTTGTGCSWTASSSDAWLVIQNGSYGSGAGQVQFNISENPSTSPRIGFITVEGETQKWVYTLTQLAQPAVYPTVTLAEASFTMGNALVGVTSYQTVTVQNTGTGVLYIGSISLLSGTAEFRSEEHTSELQSLR